MPRAACPIVTNDSLIPREAPARDLSSNLALEAIVTISLLYPFRPAPAATIPVPAAPICAIEVADIDLLSAAT